MVYSIYGPVIKKNLLCLAGNVKQLASTTFRCPCTKLQLVAAPMRASAGRGAFGRWPMRSDPRL